MIPLPDDTFRYSPRALIACLQLDRADPEGPARTLAVLGEGLCEANGHARGARCR